MTRALILALTLALSGCSGTLYEPYHTRISALCEPNDGWKYINVPPLTFLAATVRCNNGAKFKTFLEAEDMERTKR